MEQNKTNNKRRRKPNYINHTKYICSEYILLDENETIMADFKTLKEALQYKEQHQETQIYILKTYKLN